MASVQPMQYDPTSEEARLDEMLFKAEQLAQQMKVGNETPMPTTSKDENRRDTTPVVVAEADDILHRISEATSISSQDSPSIFCDDSTAQPTTKDSTPALMRQTEALLALLQSSAPSPEKTSASTTEDDSSPLDPRTLTTPTHTMTTVTQQSDAPVVTPPASGQVEQAEQLARLMKESLSSLASVDTHNVSTTSEVTVSESTLSPDRALVSVVSKTTSRRPPLPTSTVKPGNASVVPKRESSKPATTRPNVTTPSKQQQNDPDIVPVTDYLTPRRTSITNMRNRTPPNQTPKMQFQEGDDLLRIADITTQSPSVKWQKMSSATDGDDDFVPLKDFSQSSPKKTTGFAARGGALGRKNALRPRKKTLRAITFLLIVVSVVSFLGTSWLRHDENPVANVGSGMSEGKPEEYRPGHDNDDEELMEIDEEIIAIDDEVADNEDFGIEEFVPDADFGLVELDDSQLEEAEGQDPEELISAPRASEIAEEASFADNIPPSDDDSIATVSVTTRLVERGHLEKKFAQWTRAGLKHASVLAKRATMNLQSDLGEARQIATDACVDEILPVFAGFSGEWQSLSRSVPRQAKTIVEQRARGVIQNLQAISKRTMDLFRRRLVQ